MLVPENPNVIEPTEEQKNIGSIIGQADLRIRSVMVFGSYRDGQLQPLADKDFLLIVDPVDPNARGLARYYLNWIGMIQNRAGEALDESGIKVVEHGDDSKEKRAGKVHLCTVVATEVEDRKRDGSGLVYKALTEGKTVWVKE